MLAREKLPDNAIIQTARVIVHVHREQALLLQRIRGHLPKSGRLSGRLALAFRGVRPLERPTEQDRSDGMSSTSEAPNDRGKSPWLLGALPSDSL
ncbi:hypothetical protein CES87_18840 [Pseudomonas sp. ERMR1:02]|nr:hypothetical protein CES87_18840 [Pseudomonas sp. ERMR1:02]